MTRRKEIAVESRIPPLNALKAFEAAARRLNITRAAEELSVTPGPSASRSESWRNTPARRCSTAKAVRSP